MTPQELMGLPFSGMAEKELRRSGKWVLTKEEKLSNAIERAREALDALDDAIYALEKMTQ